MNTQEALDRLESFKQLEENWDSHGGSPISHIAIESAKDIIGGLFVAPYCDGSVGISFGEDELFMILIEPDGKVTIED